ncbi:unnamed protein product [Lactuca virosa]|uniref:Uncharacterized protein n=1 Tax=Lactuca virosa TaxID=75947 RepID=A0AAU9PVR3_9ASTR|nr:unnamed protein product [Lactuca virosa]
MVVIRAPSLELAGVDLSPADIPGHLPAGHWTLGLVQRGLKKGWSGQGGQLCRKEMDFLDVFAKKWAGSLWYREVDIVDKVLPSFPFCNEAFIARVMVIQEVERCQAVVQSFRSAYIDPRKAAWQSVRNDDTKGFALVQHLHPHRLASDGVRVVTVQNEVIDISDDVNVEKNVVSDVNMFIMMLLLLCFLTFLVMKMLLVGVVLEVRNLLGLVKLVMG